MVDAASDTPSLFGGNVKEAMSIFTVVYYD